MNATNLSKEEAWISAWSELHETAAKLVDPFFLLPDGQESTVDGLKAWIQDEAYSGRRSRLEVVWHCGRKSLQCKGGEEISS